MSHHSVESWRRHISRREQELSKIYEEARKAEPEQRSDSDSEDESSDGSDSNSEGHIEDDDNNDGDEAVSVSQVNHHDDDDDGESEQQDSDDADDEDGDEDEKFSEYGSPTSVKRDVDENEETDAEEDARNMSAPRKPFNEADRRVMARYIASIPEWEQLAAKDRWGLFAEMVCALPSRVWSAFIDILFGIVSSAERKCLGTGPPYSCTRYGSILLLSVL